MSLIVSNNLWIFLVEKETEKTNGLLYSKFLIGGPVHRFFYDRTRAFVGPTRRRGATAPRWHCKHSQGVSSNYQANHGAMFVRERKALNVPKREHRDGLGTALVLRVQKNIFTGMSLQIPKRRTRCDRSLRRNDLFEPRRRQRRHQLATEIAW